MSQTGPNSDDLSSQPQPPHESTSEHHHQHRKRRHSRRKARTVNPQELFQQPQQTTESNQVYTSDDPIISPSSVFVPYIKKSDSTSNKQNCSKSLLTLQVTNTAPIPQEEKSSKKKTYASQNILKSLTVGITLQYKLCSPDFKYTTPKLILTKPSTPTEPNGKDNADGNLILTVDDMLNDRYCVKDVLGQGTFGQVARCEDTKDGGKQVAVKIIKNKRAYLKQAEVETRMLELLMKHDPEDKHHIVRMNGHFFYENHLCIVTELLSINLFELIKQNRFRGLTTNVISVFLSQILDALVVLSDAGIIHCDMKPENILLTNLSSSKNLIKLIDFGSACLEGETVYSYIQSRFYRSPEVLFGIDYNTSIDMWSLGCICAELFLGLPLFPGASQYNQVARIVEMMGMPPDHLLDVGKLTRKYFNRTSDMSTYALKSEIEFCNENRTEPKEWKRYFNFIKLDDLVKHYSMKSVPSDQRAQEEKNRVAFMDLLKGLLQYDPQKRWTPRQAKQHPFVTGQPFTGPYQPEPDLNRQNYTHQITIPPTIPQQQQQPVQLMMQSPYGRHRQHSVPNALQNPSFSHLQQHFTPPQFHNMYASPIGNSANSFGSFTGGMVGPHLGPSPNTFFSNNAPPPQQQHPEHVPNHPSGIPIQGHSYHSYQQQQYMNSPNNSFGHNWNMMPHMYQNTPSSSQQYISSSSQSSSSINNSYQRNSFGNASFGSPNVNDHYYGTSVGRGSNGGNNSRNKQRRTSNASKQYDASYHHQSPQQSNSYNNTKPPKHPQQQQQQQQQYSNHRQHRSNSYHKSNNHHHNNHHNNNNNKQTLFIQSDVNFEKQSSPLNPDMSPDNAVLFEFDEEEGLKHYQTTTTTTTTAPHHIQQQQVPLHQQQQHEYNSRGHSHGSYKKNESSYGDSYGQSPQGGINMELLGTSSSSSSFSQHSMGGVPSQFKLQQSNSLLSSSFSNDHYINKNAGRYRNNSSSNK
ncbi:serine/threonine-protein kinase yak [Acrasis kona]|uniref:Serine/threonine-protein kinase yak n=1 Tax=Acrasis kona TaxID=1008807 RepID=A0AAW2ZEF9_9EUKA